MFKSFIRKKRKSREKGKARVEIAKYFALAENARTRKLANDCIRKARNLAMKNKIRFSSEQKRRFCKYCHSFLVPGKNLQVRAKKGRMIYYCLECRQFMKVGYKSY